MNARALRWVGLLAAALLAAGGVYHPRCQTRDMRETRSVEAGELRMHGGAGKLLEADFDYSVPEWRPEVRYNRSLLRGYLTVRQPSSVFPIGQRRYQ